MDIKEIVNLLYTAIGLAADGGPKAFTEEEYSEMHELLKKIKSGQFGWHPASEPPKEKDVEVVMLVDVSSPQFTDAPLIRVPIFGRYINGWPDDVNVRWWSYSPQND